MGLSTKDCVSTTGLSSLKHSGGNLKLFTFFLLAFSCLSLVIAAPTDSEPLSLPGIEKRDATTIDQRGLPQPYDALLPKEIEDVVIPKIIDNDLEKRQSAGLYWGPVYVGNLKMYLTNPHNGWAGPKFPNANHINFHVDKKAVRPPYTPVVNLHIVRYSSGGRSCLYMWDSETKTVIFDNCFDDWTRAIPEGVQAAKQFVDSLLRNADAIAAVVIVGALVVALAAAIASLGVVALA